RTSPIVTNTIVQKAMAIFKAVPNRNHSLGTLAAAVGVRALHLGGFFRRELGMTPGRWIENMRLQTAQELILEGCTITAAAQDSGFGNDENLRRAFERRFGMSPTEYRSRFSTTFR